MSKRLLLTSGLTAIAVAGGSAAQAHVVGVVVGCGLGVGAGYGISSKQLKTAGDQKSQDRVAMIGGCAVGTAVGYPIERAIYKEVWRRQGAHAPFSTWMKRPFLEGEIIRAGGAASLGKGAVQGVQPIGNRTGKKLRLQI